MLFLPLPLKEKSDGELLVPHRLLWQVLRTCLCLQSSTVLLFHCHPIGAEKHLFFRTPTLILALTSQEPYSDFQDATPALGWELRLRAAPGTRSPPLRCAHSLGSRARTCGPCAVPVGRHCFIISHSGKGRESTVNRYDGATDETCRLVVNKP